MDYYMNNAEIYLTAFSFSVIYWMYNFYMNSCYIFGATLDILLWSTWDFYIILFTQWKYSLLRKLQISFSLYVWWRDSVRHMKRAIFISCIYRKCSSLSMIIPCPSGSIFGCSFYSWLLYAIIVYGIEKPQFTVLTTCIFLDCKMRKLIARASSVCIW